MKECKKCGRERPLVEFGRLSASKDGLQYNCKECMKEYHRLLYQTSEKRRQDIRRNDKRNSQRLRGLIEAYLEGKSCIDCGNADRRVFEFDHVRGNKLFNVSEAPDRGVSWKRISEEIDKCEVTCANCHRIRTHTRRGLVAKSG